MTPNDFETIVRTRRTHMLVDPDRPVGDDTIAWLCELANWAPAHKKTWPWKFASFTGEGRRRLGDAFVADMVAGNTGDDGKRTKTLTKYMRTPNILVVGCEPHDHPTFHDENRDAVSAAVQNILLGATVRGLASFWSTAPVMSGPASLELCGFDPGDRIIGVLYLGRPTGSVPAPARPAPRITHVDS